jgi:hypothetical protein
MKEFPLSAADCRAHANRHRGVAAKTDDTKLRELHLVLVIEYDRLAEQMDAVEALPPRPAALAH